MPLVAYSYSRLTSYETCPKKYYALSVAKTVKDPSNEYTDYGSELHLSFANFLKKGTMLPLHLRQYLPLLNQIKAAPGEHVIEQKICLNEDYTSVDWFAPDAYLRVISDLTILNGAKAAMFDWKTGKMYDDFTQLKLVAGVLFILAPEVESINMAYVWTKTRKVTRETMTRGEAPAMWAQILPRVQRYQDAHAALDFPARAGDHCKYCPVKSCPHNINRKLK